MLSGVTVIFSELKRSYLSQFLYFSGQAYIENKNHPLLAYNQALACLMKGHELERHGSQKEAEIQYESAYSAIESIDEPKEGEHYLRVRYHVKNRDEFIEMRRLASRHPEVKHRIEYLARAAEKIQSEGKTSSPTMSYSISPIVGWGAKSASVLGVLILIAQIIGWDHSTITSTIDTLWVHAVNQIPQLSSHATEIVSGSLNNAGHILINTGGFANNNVDIINQLAFMALKSHTGGFS